MEPRRSLPCSQVPFTSPYLQSDKSSSCYPALPYISKIHPNIPRHTSRTSQLFLSLWFSHQNLISFLFANIRAACHTHLIFLDAIILIPVAKSTSYKTLLIMQFSSTAYCFILLLSKQSLQLPATAVLTAIIVKSQVQSDYGYKQFGGICCLHIQVRILRQKVPPRRYHLSTRLRQSLTSQEIVILISLEFINHSSNPLLVFHLNTIIINITVVSMGKVVKLIKRNLISGAQILC